MEKKKYKSFSAARESNPAFDLNQIGKIAFNRAKATEKYQRLEVINALLMCALTMEAVVNNLGKCLFEDWEEKERLLNINQKVKMIAKRSGLDVDLGSLPFQYLSDIFRFRDSLVHAKSSKHFSPEVTQSEIDENGFPIIDKVAELMTDWEKHCNIETAEKWRNAVYSMSSTLSEATKCQDPVKISGAIDTWGVIET
ncbi:MAG: hypothetical protein ISR58_13175 [Anaerolineales bacterium]|nr:hypothetical protein [Candidatus Brocadiales bacterium]MBL6982128.1 hypothetical protein [Anaerolineales bacterium]